MSHDEKETLKVVVALLHKHDTKLSLDYASIQRLEKDTDKLAKSTGSLAESVATLSGAMKIQSNIMNGILAVTVIAFLGFAVRTVYEPAKPQPREVAAAFVDIMQNEVRSQINIAQEIDRAHKKAKGFAVRQKGALPGVLRTTP